jgi:hypothetical protein
VGLRRGFSDVSLLIAWKCFNVSDGLNVGSVLPLCTWTSLG